MNLRIVGSVLLALSLVLGGCASQNEKSGPAARLERLGRHSMEVTTDSAEAQKSFDRGLNLAYSFAHYAAEQEFRAAAKADPECAMAYWGIALVNGPHINFPLVPPDKAAVAWEAMERARRLAGKASALEQSLIKALGTRYANPQPEDRGPLDVAYAEAMRGVYKAYPADADVATLCAEALMDLHPWDFWADEKAQPWTPEIAGILENALRLNKDHPGANHYYIHVMEASPEVGKAVAAAERLGGLVPDAGHMVHMPAHIYVRAGRWEDAAEANRRAMKADALFRSVYSRPGFYRIYMAHNEHFLTWTAMMKGNSAEAMKNAQAVVKGMPAAFLDEWGAVADGFFAIVPETLMRFGRWEEILKEPEPRADLFLARAMWRYARACALTALDRREEAAAEREAFEAAVKAVPADRTMGNNLGSDLLVIATLTLDGEMAARRNEYDVAIAKLREAAGREDKLRYNEPPDWIQPVRHTLGAVLLRAGRAAEAEAVYRQDLVKNPENGWALMGLRDALLGQGKEAEAKETDARFAKAWKDADVSPKATCYCQAR